MYTFEDKLNGESLTLRPEATAGIVRATIQHHLTYDRPQRVWTSGPMFRHERPQKGRYRQFHQVDVEALGFEGPDVDAEQIVMLARLWKALELAGHRAADQFDRQCARALAHRNELVAYLERHADALDADARRRLHANPLRILDSKNPAMQPLLEAAPKLISFIEDKSLAHFEALQALARGRRASPTGSIRGSCAGSTTTTAPCSNGWRPVTLSAARARWPAADVTTACSNCWAAPPISRAASRSASSG